MSPDFRSFPLGFLNSDESSYLKVRHVVAYNPNGLSIEAEGSVNHCGPSFDIQK